MSFSKENHYKIERILKRGPFSKTGLYKNLCKNSSQVCIKTLYKSKCKFPESIENIKRRMSVFRSLNSPFLVNFFEMKESGDSLFLIFEFCEGENLRDYLQGQVIPEKDTSKILYYVLKGLEILYEKGLEHGNIKPENILMTKDKNEPKLSDYGLPEIAFSDPVQSSIYRCPDSSGSFVSTEKKDVWAIGVVLFEMLYGTAPNEDDIRLQIEAQEQEKQVQISELAKDLLIKTLCTDSDKRIAIKEVLSHSFFKGKEHIPSYLENIENLMITKGSDSQGFPKESQYHSFGDSHQNIEKAQLPESNFPLPNSNPECLMEGVVVGDKMSNVFSSSNLKSSGIFPNFKGENIKLDVSIIIKPKGKGPLEIKEEREESQDTKELDEKGVMRNEGKENVEEGKVEEGKVEDGKVEEGKVEDGKVEEGKVGEEKVGEEKVNEEKEKEEEEEERVKCNEKGKEQVENKIAESGIEREGTPGLGEEREGTGVENYQENNN